MARDYGNGNRTFQDERIDDYFVNDLSINYKLWDNYNLFSILPIYLTKNTKQFEIILS